MTGQWIAFIILCAVGSVLLVILYEDWQAERLRERLDEVPLYVEDEV